MPERKLSAKLGESANGLSTGEALLQYGALCYHLGKKRHNIELLLITSRETGRWVIPKGWPIEGKEPYRVAEREAQEEAGVRGKAARKPIGHFTYFKCFGDGRKAACVVQVHPLKVESVLESFKEKGERQIAWFSCREAAELVQEPELKDLIRQLEAEGQKLARR